MNDLNEMFETLRGIETVLDIIDKQNKEIIEILENQCKKKVQIK